MLNRRRFIAAVALSSPILPRLLGQSALAARSYGGEEPPAAFTICAIGDLERASVAGRMLLSQEDFPDVDKLVAAVAGEKPDLLLLLGDQVADAADPLEWRYFDALTAPLRDARIPMLAVRGEHEYNIVNREMCDAEVYKRWPETKNRPHLHTIGPLGLIMLDTSFDMLSEAEQKLQQQRFVDALAKCDADPAIRAVVVVSHHPPYSNSTTGANEHVIEQFATPFLAAAKTRMFLNGHVHSYERFTHSDSDTEKFFVTSGGGSGPRRTIDVSDSRPFTNDVERLRRYPVRPYHYLRMKIREDAMTVETMMAQTKGFVVGDRFAIRLG